MRAILLASAAVLALSPSASAQGMKRTTTTSGIFATISEGSILTSEVVGLDVYDDSMRDVGQIIDIATNQAGQMQAYILSIGGVLGMGEHYVAVNPQAIKLSYSDADQAWHASMNATDDQLKAAPEFQYSGRLAAKACINILK